MAARGSTLSEDEGFPLVLWCVCARARSRCASLRGREGGRIAEVNPNAGEAVGLAMRCWGHQRVRDSDRGFSANHKTFRTVYSMDLLVGYIGIERPPLPPVRVHTDTLATHAHANKKRTGIHIFEELDGVETVHRLHLASDEHGEVGQQQHLTQRPDANTAGYLAELAANATSKTCFRTYFRNRSVGVGPLASSSPRNIDNSRMSRAREPCGSRSRRRSTPPAPAKLSATSRLSEALLKPLQWILRPRW